MATGAGFLTKNNVKEEFQSVNNMIQFDGVPLVRNRSESVLHELD